MKKYKFSIKNKLRRGKVKRAIPLFASFFLAQFPLPAGSMADKQHTSAFSPDSETLKFIRFELDMYKLYEDAGLEQAGLSLEVFNKAMVGYLNLLHQGKLSDKKILTIADFDKPSSEKRLWVIDLEGRQILFNSLVAHGKNSGLEKAEVFSNTVQSEMSSLGFYVTQNIYQGKHGLSLRLEGMDQNYNNNALERNVVVHGADYVSDAFVKQNGRLGRSQGCPALPMANHKEIISTIQDNTCLYLHASDSGYYSQYLDNNVAMDTYYNQNTYAMNTANNNWQI
jgi:hypothetical protein